MSRTLIIASALAIALALSPVANSQQQAGNPSGMVQGTVNAADQLFVQAAAFGGQAEVDFARLADGKSHNDAVRDFAKMMTADHDKANSRLGDLAKAAHLQPPKGIDREHAEQREGLAKLTGAEFDRAYMRGQVWDHQRTAQLLEYEIGAGQDRDLKAFASEILPIVMRHLEAANALAATLPAATAQTAATPEH